MQALYRVTSFNQALAANIKTFQIRQRWPEISIPHPACQPVPETFSCGTLAALPGAVKSAIVKTTA
jgi:hypothetical protein